MTQIRRSRLVVALALVFTLSLSTTTISGCYGQFAVTKKLYDWNGSINNRFAKSLVFWAFIIIPAYQLVMLGDFLIFNVIEFWGGKNVISGQGRAAGPPPRRIAKDTIELRRGGHVYHMKLRGESLDLEVDGKRVAEGKPDDKGGLVLTNFSKKTVGYISPETIAQIKAKLAAAPTTPSAS